MDLLQKVNLYRSFDSARQEDLQHFAQEFEAMKNRIGTLEADLDDERTNRRKWRQRAEVAESSLGRNQFAVVLIDGDNYHFNRDFYMSADESGGAQAAHALYTDIQNYLKASQTNLLEGSEYNEDVEVMAIVYFNKDVPMRVLLNADIIQAPIHFNEFMWSFTSSRSLFQTIDCGPGKERVDAKIRAHTKI
ncbi:hypothetical protein LTS08_005701 [Lithohypha guttulata]|uniref:DUF7923 domain-containing protein n=1 Tax=Lithohypha guttulata TaxID=1690604 RepID=A0AAN7Y7I4_9EURO|nr:hypothetical protein LTR05_004121 [Lithohypha guttulata]KAK5099986.1 hypothetical protein LTS08_005701 [Lithohypha guttulata]